MGPKRPCNCGEVRPPLEQAIQDLQVALYDYNRERTQANLYDVLHYARKLYAAGKV